MEKNIENEKYKNILEKNIKNRCECNLFKIFKLFKLFK